jgi:hypothetical protein
MERKKSHLLLQLLLVLFPLGLMGIGLYCCSYKRGFSIAKISSPLHHNEMWETRALSYQERQRLDHEILSQTFYYHGSGSQCYAFASEDGKYVLKFFKMHKILPKNWLRDFPFSLFEKYRLDNVEKRQDVFETFFKSFKDAYEHLSEDCGLIYLHLNKTRDLKKKVTLIGYAGEKFIVDLDSKEFIVQLEAKKLTDYLLELKDKGTEEETHLAVRSLLEIVAHRCNKGYGDQDIAFRNNFGFVNGKAVLVDCSHLFADTSLKYPHHFQAEILNVAEMMSQWGEQFYPDLSMILQEEAQAVIDKYLK